MSDMTRVALDAMGGDNAPVEMVKGAVEAVQKRNDIQVLLTGKEEILKEELAKYTYPDEKIHIVNATEVIETAEPPVKAIRSKKDSSLVTAMKLVRNGEADAFVSAGNSGAVLVGGQLLVGKIKGVERPPLAPLIPTLKGVSLVKETFPLLKECPDINFIGSVEAREIPYGDVDVIVCEAFVGNVILKLYEGVAGALVKKIKSGMMANLKSKIGGLLVKPALKDTLKDFDTSEHGGAPLLGLKGLVVKTHGSSTSKEVCNSIIQCVTFKEQKINEKITSVIQKNQENI